MLKVCLDCGGSLPEGSPHQQKRCKDCQTKRIYQKQLAYIERYKQRHPEKYRQVRKKAARNYRTAHPETNQQNVKRWKKANREHVNAYMRAFRNARKREPDNGE